MKKLLIPFIKNDTAKTYVKTILFYFLIVISVSSCSKDDGQESSPAKFSIDQNSVDFGDLQISMQKNTKVIITNTGEQDLILESFTLSGTNASEFLINETEKTIEAGKTHEIFVGFKPMEEGNKTASLTITSNIEEHLINLSGNALPVPEPKANIPDTNFKASLLDHGVGITGTGISKIDTNDDGEIQISEAQAYVGVINCNEKNISDLTGIEAFVNVTEIRVVRNQLTNIDVSQNTALEQLACDENELSDIDISGNTSLKVLWLQKNGLADLDISQNTALESIYLGENHLTTLNTSHNANLRTLVISSNQLESLDVSSNTTLSRLWVHVNNLTSLDLSQNTALKDLYLNNNELTSLDVSKNMGLEDLSCDNNKLVELDLSQNTQIKELRCNYNQLKDLDVSQLTNLELFSCVGNQLTSLDISQNTALKSLSCAANQLKGLNISQNTILNALYCYDNLLTGMNLANGNNINLSEMVAYGNNLTCIQIDPDFTPPATWEKDPAAGYYINCY